MDPVSALGLAASIIAVIQLTAALIKPATTTLGPSENDEKELKRLQTTIIGFQVAYNNLEHHLKSNPGTAESVVTAIQQPIQDCKAILSELQLRLSTMTFVRKHIIGKKWDKQFKHFVKRLDDARQLFDVILQGDQSERLIKISQFMAEKFKDIEALDHRFSEMHLTVQTNQQKLELQASQNQSELQSTLESYQNKMDNQEQRKVKNNILQWLAVVDARQNHDSACATNQLGTGDWFTKGQSYLNWLTEPKSFFWLNGKAGCGKTILSSTIIESTIKYCNENEGCVISYFYFSFTDAEKQDCSNMICSLLAQLASQVDITPECLLSLHRNYQTSRPPIKETMKSLQTLLNDMPFDHVYIIVDAIDEIPDTSGRKEACERLNELSQNAKAHILTTSRRERDITEYMAECNILDISIQNPEVDRDILFYVRERLQNEKKFMKWSAVHSEIVDSLSRQADGMFRWVACQLDTLKKCVSVNAVRKTLKSLPKTLDETYERILLAIDKDYQDFAIEALRWLCFSERLMTIQELAEAAIFSATVQSPSDESPLEVFFDKDDRIQDPLDILEILSGLVICRKNGKSEHEILESPSSNILLAHFSIKEFLVSDRLKNEVRHFSIDEYHAHETLATNCLYYILYSQPFIASDRDEENYLLQIPYDMVPNPSSPMFPYAAGNWLKHIRKGGCESELAGLIILFLQADLPLKYCLLLEKNERRFEFPFLMPIYLASVLDLYWCCKSLVETGADVNIQGGFYGSALQAASISGSGHIVSLLLENGANINMLGGAHGSALAAASYGGKESIVQLLLSSGADVNTQGGDYASALVAASCRGIESIVQLLLDNGADVNIQGGGYGSALAAASCLGIESIVQLLLDNGADVNIQGGGYGNALAAASYRGIESIVQLLLDNGADVNATGALGTALDIAMHFHHTQIAVILLERGATISCYPCRGGTESEDALARKDFERFVEIEMGKSR